MDLELDQFKLRLKQQTALVIASTRLQSEGVRLDTPGGKDLLRDRVQQQLDSGEIEALRRRIARGEFLARSAKSRAS